MIVVEVEISVKFETQTCIRIFCVLDLYIYANNPMMGQK